MKKLPNWALTNPFPTFYDSESGTSIEQTAKVYKAMQTLIEEHNKFIADINKFLEDSGANNNEFKECITSLVENYIRVIDEKLKMQDLNIDSTFQEMKNKLEKYVEEGWNQPLLEMIIKTIKEILAEERIVATTNYDEATENLEITLSYKE